MLKEDRRTCVVGTSLINCLYIKKLLHNTDVTIFEHQTLGGAWQSKILEGTDTPIYNNIICPMKKEEEESINEIAEELRAAKADIKIYKHPIYLASGYKPKRYILGRYNKLILETMYSSKKTLKSQTIKTIEVIKDRIVVNGEAFDELILPENFYSESITNGNKIIKPRIVTHVSKHVRVLFKNKIENYIRYTENCDNIFDRGGVNNYDNKLVFIGRVRKEHKHKNLETIIDKSSLLSQYKRLIIQAEINSYNHSYAENLEAIKQFLPEDANITYLQTRQFVQSYLQMKEEFFTIRSATGK